MLVVWVQCFERELVHLSVTLQWEGSFNGIPVRSGIEGGLNVPERKAGDLHTRVLEAVLPRDSYRARTCKLKSNGTKALQHLPPYAENCV